MILKDKVAVVTGGGRGLGKAIAVALAKEGARLVLVSRTVEELDLAAKETGLAEKDVLKVSCDISKESDVERLVLAALTKFGTIDILVNNAGVIGPIGPVGKINAKDWIATINTNLIGTFLCTQAILPELIKTKSGKIINIAGSGEGPLANFSAYASSKSALLRFTEVLAEEVKGYNIDVNAAAPGGIKTDMTKEIFKRAKGSERERAEKVLSSGGVSLEVCSKLVVFLASSKSDGISGKIISAVHDNWREFSKTNQELKDASMYTMRRIHPDLIKRLGGQL